MAEKSNEELLDALETAISKVYGHDDMPAYHKARAAVLARMCGPGEVVVPKIMTDEMFNTARQVYDDDENANAIKRWNAMLAARPNNGGTDDQGK